MTWHSARGIARFVAGPHLRSSHTGAIAPAPRRPGGTTAPVTPQGRGSGGRCPDGGGGSGSGGRSPHGALGRGRCGGARAALPWRSPPPPPPSKSASWARATGECGGPWQGGQLGGRRGPACPEAVPARALLSVPARRRGRAPLRGSGREFARCRRWNAVSPGCGGLCVALVPCGRARPALPGARPALVPSERRCCPDALRGRSGRIEPVYKF